MTTAKEVKAKVYSDTCSKRNGVFTIRKGFFYRHGRDTQHWEQKVMNAFPNASIIDSGEIWKAFRGGASTKDSSHWFVKFILNE